MPNAARRRPRARLDPACEDESHRSGGPSAGAPAQPPPHVHTRRAFVADALYATLKTNQGDIVVKLFPDHAPKPVKNFTDLAPGARACTDPKTGQKSTARLYDGTVFHRVIGGFMIQGGDPLGSGMGGPG